MKGLAALCSQCLLFMLSNNSRHFSLKPAALRPIFAVSFVATLGLGYTSPNRHHVAGALAVSDSRLRHRAVWKLDRSGTVIIPLLLILAF